MRKQISCCEHDEGLRHENTTQHPGHRRKPPVEHAGSGLHEDDVGAEGGVSEGKVGSDFGGVRCKYRKEVDRNIEKRTNETESYSLWPFSKPPYTHVDCQDRYANPK